MKVVFEPTEKFTNLPKDYQDAAQEYLIGKEFDSLNAGLHSIEEQNKYLGIRFYVGNVNIKPLELPTEITRVPITALLKNEEQKPYEVNCLVAKIKG